MMMILLQNCEQVGIVMWQFLEQDNIIAASSTGEVIVYKFDENQQVHCMFHCEIFFGFFLAHGQPIVNFN